MEMEIDYTKSAQENAQDYFEKAKAAKKKLEGAEQAIKRLQEKVKALEKSKIIEKKIKKREEREWYEKFYWFFTSNGMLAMGGRSAQQNEEIVARYMEANDLFFHANIFGASAVILKNGKDAPKEIKEEAAQFAACFSKAWENGSAAVDVFAAKKDQISKSSKVGYLSTGSFLISGEREWFKNVKLELCAFVSETRINLQKRMQQDNIVVNYTASPSILVNTSKFNIVPETTHSKLGSSQRVRLTPGKMKKSDAAGALSKKLNYGDIDYIMQHLPPGGFSMD